VVNIKEIVQPLKAYANPHNPSVFILANVHKEHRSITYSDLHGDSDSTQQMMSSRSKRCGTTSSETETIFLFTWL